MLQGLIIMTPLPPLLVLLLVGVVVVVVLLTLQVSCVVGYD